MPDGDVSKQDGPEVATADRFDQRIAPVALNFADENILESKVETTEELSTKNTPAEQAQYSAEITAGALKVAESRIVAALLH